MLTIDTYQKITARDIGPGSNLLETDLQHRHHAHYAQPGAADAVAAVAIAFRAYKGGTVLAAYITPDVVPTVAEGSSGKTVTVDLKKSTAGGAWATVLTGTTKINSTATARTPIALSLSGTPTLIAGDLLQWVVTVAGSAGNNVQGLACDLVVAENCA